MNEIFTAHLGKKNEPPIRLRKSNNLLVVRTHSTRSISSGPVATPAQAIVGDANVVMEFPEAGVVVYSLREATKKNLATRKEKLNELPDIRFAGTGLVDDASGEPVVYTENIFIKFKDRISAERCQEILREEGLRIIRQLGYATNAWFAAAPEGTGVEVFTIANRLIQRREVEYCHPELIRARAMRVIFNDQWHLKDTAINGTVVQASANVEAAHQVTMGEGVVIAIIDDGVDIEHPELGIEKIIFPRDVSLGTDNPRPKYSAENHGTACAGVACASGVTGASGVAPASKLLPIRLSSALGAQQEADAFTWAADHGADIISCSWGPVDGPWYDPDDASHEQSQLLPASTRLAMDYATAKGRNGKGCVIFFAAGNGNERVDRDGYASYEKVIAVGACNDRSERSVYSDYGNALWCSFPSSDFGYEPFDHPEPLTPGIWTTDRRGAGGYNPGDNRLGDAEGMFTNGFGGTSSSCPGAAGIAALMLAANPSLTRMEVKELLGKACDKIDPEGGEYSPTGKSLYYGYGRLNAQRAVQLAIAFERQRLRVTRLLNLPVRSGSATSATLEITEQGIVKSFSVQLKIIHPRPSELSLALIPPARLKIDRIDLFLPILTTSAMIEMEYNDQNTPALHNIFGKKLHGLWSLRIVDSATGNDGRLISFGLEMDRPPARSSGASSARAVRKNRKSSSKARKAG